MAADVTTDAPDAPPDVPPAPEWIDVFISYSRRDGGFVRRLHEALTARDKEVWVDWEDIPATAAWRERIADGIDSANAIVYVLSPDSVESVECNAELDLAAAANKRIVPVVRRDVDPAGVRVELASLNWLFFRETDDFDEAFARLVDALETDLAWLDTHTRMLKRAREWDSGGRDKSFLLRGRDLDAAEGWLRVQGDHDEAATPLQVDYIVASRQSSTKRQRITLGAVGTALAVSIGLTALALVMRSQAISREHTARSRELAVSAVSLLGTDPELGLDLAREGSRTAPTAEAQVALRRLLAASPIRSRRRLDSALTWRRAPFSPDGSRAVMTGSRGRALGWTAPSSTTVLSGSRVRSYPELSADGRLAVFVRRDGSAPIVRTRDWKQVGLLHGPLSYASLLGDGRIALTERRGKLELRRVADDRVLASFGDGKVVGYAASADGRLVAEDSNLNPGGDVPASEALLWRAPWRHPVRLKDESDPVFSSRGRVLVTQSACGLVVRDGVTGRLLHRLETGPPCPSGALLSPDGSVVVATREGGDNVAWRTATGERMSELPAVGEQSSPVAFSRDNELLVTAGDSGVAFVWDLAAGIRLSELRGAGTVVGASFSPANRRVTTLSDDGVLRRWALPAAGGTITVGGTPMGVVASGGHVRGLADATSEDRPPIRWRAVPDQGRLRAHRQRMPRYEVVQAAAGPYALLTHGEKVALVDARTGRFVRDVAGDDGMTFSPNGRFLLLPSDRGAVVRAVPWWRRVGSVSGFDFSTAASNSGVALAYDGSRVFAANPGGSGIWDVPGGKRLAKLPGLQTFGLIGGSNATFSHDGRRLALMSDGRTRILDGRTGEPVAELRGQASPSWVEFSPDDALVVTAGSDGTVRVWDAATGTLLSTLHTHDDLLGVTFDRRAPKLVTWTLQGVVRVYDCDVCGDLRTLERRADARITRKLTATERRRYGL